MAQKSNVVTRINHRQPRKGFIGGAVERLERRTLFDAIIAPVSPTSSSLPGIRADDTTIIGPVDVIPPEGQIAPIASVTTYGTTSLTISVTYTDNAAIDPTSISPANLSVMGPGGLSLSVTSGSTSQTIDASAVTALYVLAAPAGGFVTADNGTFTVSLATTTPGAVVDSSGNPTLLASASFSIAVVAPPTAAFDPASPITHVGTQPELVVVTYTDTIAMNAASIAPGNVLVEGSGGALSVSNVQASPKQDAASITATYFVNAPAGGWVSSDDGSYTVSLNTAGLGSATDTSGGTVLPASGSFSVDVPPPPIATFTAPAPITSLNAGAESIVVTYSGASGIDASTINSANLTVSGPVENLPVTGVSVSPAGDASVITATYTLAAPQGGWQPSSNGTYAASLNTSGTGSVADTSGNLVLPASGQFSVDVPPPPTAAFSTPAAITSATAAAELVTVTYSDLSAVDASTITQGNLSVTSPAGDPSLTVTSVSVTPAGNAASITATYTIAVPTSNGGGWSATEDGVYVITLLDSQVADLGGERTPAMTTQFDVAIPTPPPTLDTGFSDGAVSSGFVAESAGVQSDGKIVIAGRTGDLSAGTSQGVIERLNADGSLDTTFADAGKFTTPAGENDAFYSVVFQRGGDLVAGGAHSGKFAVDRFLPDGVLDPSFAAGGQAVTTLGGASDSAYAVAVAPDGSIVAGGASDGSFAFVRYLSDGSLDTFFGERGVSLFATGAGKNETIGGLALEPDGSIVASGADGTSVELIRLNADGSEDSTFAGGGAITVQGLVAPQGPTGPDYVDGVALQPDGKILVANATTSSHFGVARFNANGSIDSTFGSNGIAVANFGGDDAADAVIAQPTGEILAIGTTTAGGSPLIAVAAFGRDGSLDATFGNGGLFTTPAGFTTQAAGGVSPRKPFTSEISSSTPSASPSKTASSLWAAPTNRRPPPPAQHSGGSMSPAPA